MKNSSTLMLEKKHLSAARTIATQWDYKSALPPLACDYGVFGWEVTDGRGEVVTFVGTPSPLAGEEGRERWPDAHLKAEDSLKWLFDVSAFPYVRVKDVEGSGSSALNESPAWNCVPGRIVGYTTLTYPCPRWHRRRVFYLCESDFSCNYDDIYLRLCRFQDTVSPATVFPGIEGRLLYGPEEAAVLQSGIHAPREMAETLEGIRATFA